MSLITFILSCVNALTVVALAIITWQYARSAKEQADATRKQADVAERQLAILQSQLEEQAGIGLAKLKESIAELKQTANHWYLQMTR